MCIRDSYYTNESAKETVERIAEIERGRSEKFFVEIGPLKNYYPAEEYHQNYLEKNPNGYCHIPRAEMELFSRLRIDPGDYQKRAAESIRAKLTAEQYRVTQESGTEQMCIRDRPISTNRLAWLCRMSCTRMRFTPDALQPYSISWYRKLLV